MRDLKRILEKFENTVSKNVCKKLAIKHRLVRRSTSQLKGHEFAQAMMVPNGFLESETLNSLAVRMQKINNECNLSASALAQRINTKGAVAFMKACFGKVIKEIIQDDFAKLSDLPNLTGFNRLLIEDSTKAELHEKLSPYFKGTGGAASKAAVKIDFIFNYTTEEVIDVDFFSGNIPDQSLASRLVSILEKNDLVVRDLGYYALARLKEIEQGEAYYVSRLKSDVVVYASKEAKEPLNLAKFLDQRIGSGIVDVEVFIGKEKIPTRLIACQMSEEAVNKRRRSANRSAKRHGTKVSKKKCSLLKYSIFITNVPKTMLSSSSVMAIYRARWRIELIFKQWKSCLKLHIFKGYNKERLYCFLYGRLIMVLLLGALSPLLMKYAAKLGCELSCFKLTNYIIADHALPRAIQEGKIDQFIDQLLKDLKRRLCMDKRRRLSLRDNVRSENSYYQAEMTGLDENVA